MKLTYTIKENESFDNIKHILKAKFEISDRLLTKLKKDNRILLNGVSSNIYSKVNCGDVVEVLLDFEEKSENIVPKKMDLNIIYEDEFLLVINKPAGIPVHTHLRPAGQNALHSDESKSTRRLHSPLLP